MALEANECVEITARCLCRAYSFTTTVPQSDLPLKASACHCTSCRHSTGALYTCDAPWPGPTNEIRRSSLSRYVFTQRTHIRFCSTCSTPMFFEEYYAGPEEPSGYGVFTGTLGNNDLGGGKRLVSTVDHIFLSDTLDGGASVWMRETGSGDGTRAKRWFGPRDKSEEVPDDWPPISSLPAADVKSEAADIPVRCRCRGVDLVFHHGQMLADFEGKPRTEIPRFIDPVTHKTLGSFDACNSCRLSLGTDVIYWTFVLLRHLSFPEGTAGRQEDLPLFPQTSADLKAAVLAQENRDPRFGTLSLYASSSDVQRYFCSRCSATVFYACDEHVDDLDIAVGLLDAPDGARAESILKWSLGATPSWRQDVVGGWRDGLFTDIVKEAEAWRIERGYPKGWRRAELEEAKKKGETKD